MNSDSFRFINIQHDGDKVVVTTGAMSWPEISDRFLHFLRACGFELTQQDLSDHYDQSYLPLSTHQEFKEEAELIDDPEEQPAQFESDENHAESYGMHGPDTDPSTLEDSAPSKPLYEFTITDGGLGLDIEELFDRADDAAREHEEFLLQNGDVPWPEYTIFLIAAASNKYSFEVHSV